ncbi:MAG: C39 family peptidase [Micromonosporaceae bacterium]
MRRLASTFTLGTALVIAALGLTATVATAQQVNAQGTDSPASVERSDVTTSGVLDVAWEQQVTGYFCGPAATRMALKAQTSSPPGQWDLASMMGTDQNGTDHVGLVADAMNSVLGSSYYEDKYLDYSPTQAQRDLFTQDVIYDIDRGYAIVANIWVAAGGPRPPGYPSGAVFHYVTIIGYDNGGDRVLIADPAAGIGGFENVESKYWLDTYTMGTLIGGKGYAA